MGCRTGGMQERKNSGLERQERRDSSDEGCRTGGMQCVGWRTSGMLDRWDAGQEGYRKRGMQERRDAGKEGCRKREMQKRDAGQERCRKGGIQKRREPGPEGYSKGDIGGLERLGSGGIQEMMGKG